MGSLLRKEDEKCSDIVSDFLDEHFYSKCETIERVNDKNRQIKGIDVIFTLDGKKFICDEKSAIRYVNKKLKTFSMELSFLDKGGNVHEGWLLDENKINDSFLFIWIDKAKKDILSDKNDIQEIEYSLVYKRDIINYLESIGWDELRLIRKSELIRENENEYCGDLYKDGCRFVCSRFLYEKPVNVLIKREKLKKLSVLTEKIVKNGN